LYFFLVNIHKKCIVINRYPLYMEYEMKEIGHKAGTSKFIRKYGMTLLEMSVRYGVSRSHLRELDMKGELRRFIDDHERMNLEPVGKK